MPRFKRLPKPVAAAPDKYSEIKSQPAIESTPAPLPGKKPSVPGKSKAAALRDDSVSASMPVKSGPVPETVSSSGVIKGPKVMPAVPAADVDTQVMFEKGQNSSQTLLERHNKPSAQLQPVSTPEEASMDPALIKALEEAEKNTQKLTVSYNDAATELDDKQSLIIKHNITPQMAAHPELRLQIQAFSGTHDAGQSSDRRIALSRALGIRSLLLESGIDPSRLDVRALGANTDQSPLDRADLYLYGPGRLPAP